MISTYMYKHYSQKISYVKLDISTVYKPATNQLIWSIFWFADKPVKAKGISVKMGKKLFPEYHQNTPISFKIPIGKLIYLDKMHDLIYA